MVKNKVIERAGQGVFRTKRLTIDHCLGRYYTLLRAFEDATGDLNV